VILIEINIQSLMIRIEINRLNPVNFRCINI